MRNRLFKALGADEADKTHWYTGYYWRTQDTTYCIALDYDENPNNTHHYILFDEMTDWGLPNRKLRADINPATLCEYTGKLDYNKKRIWEHDIVRITNTCLDPAAESLYVIRYWENEAAFVFTDPKEFTSSHMGAFHDMCDICRIEVVWNEFDTPELLENIRYHIQAEFKVELEAEVRKRGIKHD